MVSNKVPTESEEQQKLIQWCNRKKNEYPELGLIFAIPNGGRRHIKTASVLKLEGVKPGVPDMFLPVARSGYHGLFIELKRVEGGALSKTQEDWKNKLRDEKYAAVVVKGCERAKAVLAVYLGMPISEVI